MANRRNSIKKIRSDERKHTRNRSVVSEIRSSVRSFLQACSAKDKPKASEHSRLVVSKLDKAVKRGIVREKTANRTKSRLQVRLNLVQA